MALGFGFLLRFRAARLVLGCRTAGFGMMDMGVSKN